MYYIINQKIPKQTIKPLGGFMKNLILVFALLTAVAETSFAKKKVLSECYLENRNTGALNVSVGHCNNIEDGTGAFVGTKDLAVEFYFPGQIKSTIKNLEQTGEKFNALCEVDVNATTGKIHPGRCDILELNGVPLLNLLPVYLSLDGTDFGNEDTDDFKNLLDSTDKYFDRTGVKKVTEADRCKTNPSNTFNRRIEFTVKDNNKTVDVVLHHSGGSCSYNTYFGENAGIFISTKGLTRADKIYTLPTKVSAFLYELFRVNPTKKKVFKFRQDLKLVCINSSSCSVNL